MSRLASLEDEILERHRALQERAKRTSVDAAALCVAHETRVGGKGSSCEESFLDASVREVLEKAARQEAAPVGDPDAPPDDCEVRDNAEASLRLQRVKIQDLEKRLQDLQETLREKHKELCEERRVSEERKTELERQKEKNKRQCSEFEKLKAERLHAQERSESANCEIRELKARLADTEKQKRELTTLTKTNDVRQKRISEELERCKSSMESLKIHDREKRDVAKKDYDKLLAENKTLERHKSELVVALRKQLKLIDVLKRQKTHMEAAKLISFTEEEFEKLICSSNNDTTPSKNNREKK